MYTQCPNCKTAYKITIAELRTAQGFVSCGQCHQLFNAVSTLSEHAHGDPHSEPHESAPSDTADATNCGPSNPHIEHPFFDTPLVSLRKAVATDAIDQKASRHTQNRATSPEPPPAIEEIPSTLQTEQSEIPDSQEWEEKEARENDERLLNTRFTATQPPLFSAPADTFRYAAGATAPAPTNSRNRRKWLTALWSLLIVIMLFVLVGQFAYYRRAQLANYDELRPWLESLCNTFNCEIPLRKALSKIVLVDRRISPHATEEGVLSIRGALINEAHFNQPYPILELNLSGFGNKFKSRRRFLPSEYLSKNVDLKVGMPPNVPIHIELEVVYPSNKILNYKFEFY
ncbi:MAG: DUF3426 domain-containing protein [Gammaproteobacteria bacterium]|nr:DUF3426 domain-containing protein [Gammaproteobacteria bacterium]